MCINKTIEFFVNSVSNKFAIKQLLVTLIKLSNINITLMLIQEEMNQCVFISILTYWQLMSIGLITLITVEAG